MTDYLIPPVIILFLWTVSIVIVLSLSRWERAKATSIAYQLSLLNKLRLFFSCRRLTDSYRRDFGNANAGKELLEAVALAQVQGLTLNYHAVVYKGFVLAREWSPSFRYNHGEDTPITMNLSHAQARSLISWRRAGCPLPKN